MADAATAVKTASAWSKVKEGTGKVASSVGTVASDAFTTVKNVFSKVGSKFTEWGKKFFAKLKGRDTEAEAQGPANTEPSQTEPPDSTEQTTPSDGTEGSGQETEDPDKKLLTPNEITGKFDMEMKSPMIAETPQETLSKPINSPYDYQEYQEKRKYNFDFNTAIANYAKMTMYETYADMSGGGPAVFPSDLLSDTMDDFGRYEVAVDAIAESTSGIVRDKATGTIDWDKSTVTCEDFFDKVAVKYKSMTDADDNMTDFMKTTYIEAVAGIGDFMKEFNKVADYESDILVSEEDAYKLINSDPKGAFAVICDDDAKKAYIKSFQDAYKVTGFVGVSLDDYTSYYDGNSAGTDREIPDVGTGDGEEAEDDMAY